MHISYYLILQHSYPDKLFPALTEKRWGKEDKIGKMSFKKTINQPVYTPEFKCSRSYAMFLPEERGREKS